MVALRKKGMTIRHWAEISQKINMKIDINEEFTFSKALDMGMLKYLDICVDVGEKASKEYVIETNLNAMMEKWDEI